MSIFQRIATIFGAKANKALDKAENQIGRASCRERV